MSHVSAMEVPGFPRPLFITDTVLNSSPTVSDKRDFIQNTIDLAHALDLQEPKVVILSVLETVSPKLKSSFDAAVLCKMADRGRITGSLLDGPLGYDVAVSVAAAETKKIVSPVADEADILVVQDLEAGTMLVKQLQYMSDVEVADLVIGARVPVIGTGRTNNMLTRLFVRFGPAVSSAPAGKAALLSPGGIQGLAAITAGCAVQGGCAVGGFPISDKRTHPSATLRAGSFDYGQGRRQATEA